MSLLTILATQSPTVRVNGLRLPVDRAWRVSDAAAELGIAHAPGDLLDVRGAVLKPGRGRPALAWAGGRPLAWDDRLPRHQSLTLTSPADLTEAATDQVRPVDAPVTLPDGSLEAGSASRRWVQGIERRRVGRLSGRTTGWEIAYASAVVHGPTTGAPVRRVALTFDDGPNPPTTDRILGLLRDYSARATFFILGQGVAPLADCARRIVTAGDELGLHSWHHDWYTRRSSAWIRADLARCQKALDRAGLPPARWLRPPYGAHNARTDAVARSLGLGIAMWDVDPRDWARPGAQVIYRRIISRARSGDVILMHDGGGDRSQTVAALAMVLKTLSARGYRFVTRSELHGRRFPFTGAMRLNLDGNWFTYTPRPPGSELVRVGPVALDLSAPILTCRGEELLPAPEACRRLGLVYTYDPAHQVVGIEGPGGVARLPLDSLQIRMNGRLESLPVPPVLYRRTGYVPLSLLRRLAPSAGAWSPTRPLGPRPSPAEAPLPTSSPVALPGFEPDQGLPPAL